MAVYSQSWAIEYYPENANTRVVIGIVGISESEAHERLSDAGFSDCGIEFSVFQTQLAGAMFIRCHPVRVGPGSVVVCDGRGTFRPPRKVLLGGAVGGSEHVSPERRFALSVAHLFSQVWDSDVMASY